MNIENFNKFKVTDKQKLRPILLKNNYGLCDYNFTNLFIWSSIHDFRWGFCKDAFFVYDPQRDFLTYGLGKTLTVSEYVEISDQVRSKGYSGNFYLFPESVVSEQREEFSRYFDLELNDYYSDYIYKTQKLVELKGAKLQKKKNLISQFKRTYPNYQVRAIGPADYQVCNDLAEVWCRATETCGDTFFIQEQEALKNALMNFEALSLQGLLLTSAEGELLGFSVFSELSDNIADIHFEKSNIEIKGSSQVINWETASYLLGRYEYLNREQDLGLNGLRQAKRSYVPEFQMQSYILKRK
ncbi:MAG: DUF2156 domain-containing protein [Oligoflexia bacterium]|nr:DUF2156 domain-containing protein [Oligoflexia bacterium]MBF0366924.1 DUF2156 domain-containing protein [Oligoflexia bacterium]